MFRRDRQPWLGQTETAVRQPGKPRHGCPTSIAAFEIGPELDAERILQIFKSDFSLSQAEFLPLINAGASPECQKRREEQFSQCERVAVHFRTLPDPRDNPQVIVVAHRPSGPSAKKNSLSLGNDLTQRSGGKYALHEFEIVTAVQMLDCPGVL